jgi:hypothetical protein
MNRLKINPDNVNVLFDRLRDKQKLSEWLVRYYFNENRQDTVWYNPNVNEDNVLAYVSDPRSGFPLSPMEVCDDWTIKKSLKSDFAQIEDEPKPVKGKKEAIYNTGDVSLKDIGEELHGITAMMAQKIETSAMDKFKIMTGACRDGLEDAMEIIDEAHHTVAQQYVQHLRAANGSVQRFLDIIKKEYQISPMEMEDIKTNPELKMINFLFNQDDNDIADYLRGDIMREHNRMKSFQTMISKHLYPSKKRGRPRKNA